MGLPGNPGASFVTFTYLARKAGRREYLRASIRRAANGLEAVKFLERRCGPSLLSD
jgi:hypothetical protein